MKILCIALAFLAFIPLVPGQLSQTPLAQTISAKHKEGKSFTTPTLFEVLPANGRSEVPVTLPAEVRDYELLQLEEENLQELIHNSPETFTLNLPSNGRAPLEVELTRVNIFSENFKVRTSTSLVAVEVDPGLHYRGIIKGDPESVAAVSIFENEIQGVFSSERRGNLTLGRLQDQGRSELPSNNYILYDDRPLSSKHEFECGTQDDGPDYTDDELSYTSTGRDAGDCVRVYFEVDNDIYKDKGSVAKVTDYVTGLFNQVAMLYANENVNVIISEIFIWDSASPYSGSSSGAILSQFQNYRKSFDGEIGQLLSYQASGGIAVLSGLCHPYSWARLSFASVNRTYNSVPTYSFSVMVVTHELGHLLGSQHTHACVWNGNNTAIDGCAGFTEGSCSNPGKPSDGGTIMSYCHITSSGINFSKGFGPQPGSVIRSRVSQGTCMQVCSTSGGGNNGGDSGSGGDSGGGTDSGGGSDANGDGCTDVTLTLTLDNFGPETSWEITDERNVVVHSGGPYEKKKGGSIMRETFCLPNGCYNFMVMDEDGDGICCDYGQGSFLLKNAANQTIASGGDFEYEASTDFCLEDGSSSGGDNGGGGSCVNIDFANTTISSYGGSQDQGSSEIVNNGSVLRLENNAWKAIMMEYDITPNTVLEFEFFSTAEGEIHGIGFDDDNSISYSLTFKVYGIQSWGRLEYDTYPGGGVWKKYSIPVGKFYTGLADRLFFACDNDRYPYGGNAYYRNVRIHEGEGCGSGLPGDIGSTTPDSGLGQTEVANFSVYPNPTSEQLKLRLPRTAANGSGLIQIYSTAGQLLVTEAIPESTGDMSINVEQLPQGTYLIRYDDGSNTATERFTILRE